MVSGNEEPEDIEGKIEDLIADDSLFEGLGADSENKENDSPESEVE
jgi:hypothetical protein